MAGPPIGVTLGLRTRGGATIVDVAAAAGVSRQTVTRAMHDMPGISVATRARVLAAAADLAYRPSRHARGLVSGGRTQIGLAVTDLTNPFSPELAAAVVRAAANRGWNVTLADVALTRDPASVVRSFGDQVDVVIGYLGDFTDEARRLLRGVPLIPLDPGPGATGPAVVIDAGPAIDRLADHLVEVGVRHPAVLDASEPGHVSLRGERMRTALEQRGLQPVVVRSTQSARQAAIAVDRLLERGGRLDAILAFNDLMALGALDACRRAGVSVPDDVRISGVDGLAIGTYLTPTLTTLPLDLDRVAAEALDLADLVQGATPHRADELLRRVENTFLVRDSA